LGGIQKILIAALVLALIASTITPSSSVAQQVSDEPLYVAFIWHYHQPWYYSADGTYFILPWVRMHSVGNYYKMAYILSKYPDIKVTFTFSGSLIVQINDYLKGMKDIRQEISQKLANGEELSTDEKFSMLQIPGGFFDINWARIVDAVPRFKELRDKARTALSKYVSLPEEQYKEAVVAEFSDQDFLDLATLFNLFWIDPEVLREEYPNIYQLRQRALTDPNTHFTRDDLAAVLSTQIDIMGKIFGIYSELASNGQAELIPVPYSHPLAPIITDFGWSDDLRMHVKRSIGLFRGVFNYTPAGVWPAEEAVNQDVLGVFAGEGFEWTVTDRDILLKSGAPSTGIYSPWLARISNESIYVVFRDTDLSNLISFDYSKWDTQQAVNDLISRLLSIKDTVGGGHLVVIALDGENPWEHYPEFGDDFLNTLYSVLEQYQEQGLLKTTTVRDYLKTHPGAEELPLKTYKYLDLEGRDISDMPLSYTKDAYSELPRRDVKAVIAEGSWAGGELAIWIGQRQENAAWMYLAKAREDLMKALNTDSIEQAYLLNPDAVENLLRAEASDWFWWYGGDGGGTFPSNPLFKAYLRRVYTSLGLPVPEYLITQYNPDATPVGVINSEVPKPVASSPTLDGNLGDEAWSDALVMPVGTEYVSNVSVAVSPQGMYVAVTPVGNLSNARVAIYLTCVWRSVSPYHLGYNPLARDGVTDLGIGLAYEVLLDPASDKVVVSAADGHGGWVPIYYSVAYSGEAYEFFIPWNVVSAAAGDRIYLTVATYVNGSVAEYATRLGNAYMIQVPASTTASGNVVFEMKDPVGDDDGAGDYEYPTNSVFKPGVFDMTGFRVIDAGDRLVFEVTVRDLGGNPWGGPNGFCLQYVQIYVHTASGPYNTTTFGLNVEIDPEYAWSFALLLAPGWGSDPVPKGQRAAMYFANGTVVVQDGAFSVSADPAANAIKAEVRKSILPDVGDVGNWSYVVVLTSYDGYGPDRIRPFGVSPDEWVVGAGEDMATAILFNAVPRVMDLLAPTPEDQYRMLRSFEINKSSGEVKLAVIKGVSPQEAQAPAVVTTTVTQTVTYTESVTERLVETTTYTTTKTSVTISTETITQPVTDNRLVGVGVILGLIAGLVAGSLIAGYGKKGV